MDKAQDAAFGFEHALAWLMALAAIVLGVIGLLIGFDILDLRGADADAGIQIAGNADLIALPGNFMDGTMLIFAGITAAILAFTLHSSDHHRMRDVSTLNKSDQSMWSVEHGLAYIMAIGSIALVVIGLLVGYGAFDTDNSQLDGLLWIWSGFGAGILTATLHAVRHHQFAETDEIVAIVTERVRTGQPATGQTQTRPTR
jgi:hypothetical protein